MEVYSIEMNHLPLEERAKLDYEAPHAIDVKLLDRQIRAYSSGQSIETCFLRDRCQRGRTSARHDSRSECESRLYAGKYQRQRRDGA